MSVIGGYEEAAGLSAEPWDRDHPGAPSGGSPPEAPAGAPLAARYPPAARAAEPDTPLPRPRRPRAARGHRTGMRCGPVGDNPRGSKLCTMCTHNTDILCTQNMAEFVVHDRNGLGNRFIKCVTL